MNTSGAARHAQLRLDALEHDSVGGDWRAASPSCALMGMPHIACCWLVAPPYYNFPHVFLYDLGQKQVMLSLISLEGEYATCT